MRPHLSLTYLLLLHDTYPPPLQSCPRSPPTIVPAVSFFFSVHRPKKPRGVRAASSEAFLLVASRCSSIHRLCPLSVELQAQPLAVVTHSPSFEGVKTGIRGFIFNPSQDLCQSKLKRSSSHLSVPSHACTGNLPSEPIVLLL